MNLPKRKHPESILQKSCKQWFDFQYPKFSRLLFAIPNGGNRSNIEAAIMKGEGVIPGVSDMMLAVPANGYPGAFIEMKWGKNTLSESQESWLKLAKTMGYATAVIYTLDEFMDFINRYINELKPTYIELVVSRNYGIPIERLHAKTQKRQIVEPRQVIMSILRHTRGSNNIAARHFAMNHASSTHANKTIINLYETNNSFRIRMNKILSELNLTYAIFKTS